MKKIIPDQFSQLPMEGTQRQLLRAPARKVPEEKKKKKKNFNVINHDFCIIQVTRVFFLYSVSFINTVINY